ncbi:MAG TPA: hypothetical protein VN773_04950, partial [Verrucomicrobiae bacterium]|nr:hypothetical protein [Verrucomicrobiae bacterium]
MSDPFRSEPAMAPGPAPTAPGPAPTPPARPRATHDGGAGLDSASGAIDPIDARRTAEAVLYEIRRVIVGQDAMLERVLV